MLETGKHGELEGYGLFSVRITIDAVASLEHSGFGYRYKAVRVQKKHCHGKGNAEDMKEVKIYTDGACSGNRTRGLGCHSPI